MIAVDTNVLVFAHREEAPLHEKAYARIRELAEGREPWAIPWPCLHEFLALVTHPRIYDPPTPLPSACDQVEAWLESPSVRTLSELERYWMDLRGALEAGAIVGPMVHDAHVAALCVHQGVSELWSTDRDFSRFGDLRVRNPLVEE